MSKSTRLLTATYILSYVAANAPEVVTTDRIAAQVDEHPARVRQIVAGLVKAGLLVGSRGASGGVSLKKAPAEITLFDIQRAVQYGSLLALHLVEPKSEWAGMSQVHLVFENLRDELESRIRSYLEEHTLDQTYTPIIVPFSPGGTSDILARALGEHLGSGLGAPALVEHVASRRKRAGTESSRQHATAAGAGLSIMTNSGVLAAALADPKTDPTEIFVPVTLLAESEMILAVSAASRSTSVSALIKAAKAATAAHKPPLRYASVGRGSVSHLCGELLQRAAGVVLQHQAYEGAQPAVRALIAGEVDLYFGTPPTFLPHVRAGSVRALATTAPASAALQKADALAELPRMAGSYPGFEVTGWQGVFAPPGTGPKAVARLHDRVVEVMSRPDVRRRLARQGFHLTTCSSRDLVSRIKAEVAQWRLRLMDAGIELVPAAR